MFFFKSRKAANPEPVFAYAQINAKLMPIARGERFETPLEEAIATAGLGEVTGGGAMLSQTKEIVFCGIDIDNFNVEHGVQFVCDFLNQRGAPRGSELQYTLNGKKYKVPFGLYEGLAIYLNGTDLPEEVYKTCALDVVIDGCNHLLGDHGSVWGDWAGPTETAVYLYGPSAPAMKHSIADLLQNYPLCQRARLVQIA